MSHYIRTIHTDYTARAAPSSSSSTHTPLILNLGSYHPKTKYPPGLPADWRSAPVAVSSGAQQPAYTRRTRRTPTVSYRRPGLAPPAPPPRTSYAYAYTNTNTNMKFDPFSDDADYDAPPSSSPVLYRTPPPHTHRLTPASLVLSPPSARVSHHPTASLAAPVPVPAPAPAPAHIDPNARSRLVAGILLNRVHAVGRPMRRRSFEGPREYVKSGLSSVISVEA